ncbi:hypothetical protein SDC9_195863 [bioreactor metagenome]|uniref:Uncharacterized protein n=1 Tax=bioreactor metagenome TaxID=1076179 RepID=A0A645IAA4_9ZZZZ
MGEQIEQQFRFVQILVREVEVDSFHHSCDRDPEMTDVIRLQLLQRRFRFRDGLRECDFKHFGDVDLDHVVQRVFEPRQAHPVAAGRNPPTGKRGAVTVFHEALHQRLVAGKARIAQLVFEQDLHPAAEQPPVQAVMNPDRQVAGAFQFRRRFEDQE